MATRLIDIAKKLGISVTSVSLVLNEKPNKIPESTRKLIRETAKDMEYTPNQIAISLKKKKTNTLGLIVPDIRNSFFANLARGIEDRCRELGYTLILCNTSDRHMRDTEYIKMLSSKNIDGVLYCMSSDSNKEILLESLKSLSSNNIPFILVDRHFDLKGVNSITLNHLKGGYIATDHLIKLGHKKIACITGPKNLTDAEDRLLGYLKALEEAKIQKDFSLIKEGKYDFGSGYEKTNDLVREGRKFSAIFACNDLMAYGAYKALKENGLRVPDDVSVMGYDDIYMSDIFEVPLTTIHQPVEELGVAATDKLIRMINKKEKETSKVIFEPELIIRNSTTHPKNEKTENSI